MILMNKNAPIIRRKIDKKRTAAQQKLIIILSLLLLVMAPYRGYLKYSILIGLL